MNSPPAAAFVPHRFQLRCAIAYGAAVAVNGVILPYFPVWLESLAFSAFEIGIIVAVQMILKVLAAPFAGLVADRMPERTAMLAWSSGLSLVTALALFWTKGFWPVLIAFGVQAAIFAPYVPIVESITVTGVRRWGFQYGSMRVWGSIGFVAATLWVGDMIGAFGAGVVPPAIAAAFVLTIVAAFIAPRLGRMAVAGRGDTGGASATWRLDLHVLMIGASLIQASHGMFYTFSTIHWKDVGFSSGAIGILWSAGVIAEIIVFFASGWLARRLSPWSLMRLGGAVAMARWALFPLPLGLGGYFALQIMHAFSFAFVHLGLQHRLIESVREEQESSMQGAYIFYNGALLAASTFLSGILYRQYGVVSFVAMVAIAVLGLAGVALAARIQPQRPASGG